MHNGSTVQGKLKTIVSSFRLIFEYWIKLTSGSVSIWRPPRRGKLDALHSYCVPGQCQKVSSMSCIIDIIGYSCHGLVSFLTER